MGIANRTFDATEQQESIKVTLDNPVNAQDHVVAIIERPQTIQSAAVSLLGISGAPTVLLKALRFVAGTGGSSFNIGSTVAPGAFGTSGYLSFSLPASGSTLLNLQKGDLIVAVTGGGAAAAATTLVMDIIVKNSQDFKSWY